MLEKKIQKHTDLLIERYPNLEVCKEDIEKAKEMVRLNKDAQAYCDSFKRCQGCKVKEFKDKYRRFGRMICSDVYKYLKEKGEI